MHFLVSVKSTTRQLIETLRRSKRWNACARALFFKVSAIAQNVPFVVKYFHGTMNKIAKADRN